MTYLMEHAEEHLRLEIKTDPESVKRQASWAGIRSGMRILDVGCGSGVTTSALADLVGEEGEVVGLDFSEERLFAARKKFGRENVKFICHDIRKPFLDEKKYDAVWMRFLLEYFREEQKQVIVNSVSSLVDGGIVCLVDLDNNSLCHDGHNERLQNTLNDIMARLESSFNFDPYAGRRLYGHLCDLGFKNLSCNLEAHHLIYGNLEEKDSYNWLKKIEIAAIKSGCDFSRYYGSDKAGAFQEFLCDFRTYFGDKKRFCYTPLIMCRGQK